MDLSRRSFIKLAGAAGAAAAAATPAPGVKRAPTTHAAMLKGEACGACHGKTAHNFDDCTSCHKQEPSQERE